MDSIEFLVSEIYLLVMILFLAGKDATSDRMKDKNAPASELRYKRISRWHRDGVALWLLATLPVFYHTSWWLLLISILLRLSVYDVSFNKWAGLPVGHLGGTSFWDRFFVRIFGAQGADTKAVTFTLIWVVFNYAYFMWIA